MTWTEALLLGGVEGLTEFLPISSTGHLMLVEAWLGMTQDVSSFNIAIQLGAIAAVLVCYGRRLLVDRAAMLRVLVAVVPTLLWGLILYKVVKEHLLQTPALVCWSLGIGGVVLILFESFHGEKRDARDGIAAMPLWQAFLIGNFQALAMVPGVSRSAATVVGGLLLGLRRRSAVEFSFMLAIPTMLAATSYDLYKSAHLISGEQVAAMSIGFAAAFATALLAIGFLLSLVKRFSFAGFGVYRIAAALFFAWVLFG